MKKFIRLVFFGLLLFLGYKYLEGQDVIVKDWLAEGKEWMARGKEWLSELIEEPAAAKEPAFYDEPVSHEEPASSMKSESISSNTTRLQSSQTRTSVKADSDDKSLQPKSDVIKQSNAVKRHQISLPGSGPEWIKSTTELHSPNSWNLLMKYEELPTRSETPLEDGSVISSSKPVGTFHYLEGSSRLDLLSSMETNVHELAHAYFRQNSFKYAMENNIFLDWDKAEGYVYVSPSEAYFVSFPCKSLFPSRELASVIPTHLRSFRFDSYINGSTSTQSEGVIGLLNELHAYYLGSQYSFDMLQVYQYALESDANGLFEWVRHTMSSMTAFYEFDFFIKEYLLFMKDNYPADYSHLISNTSFKRAYRAVGSHYEKLTVDYMALIQSEMKRINAFEKVEVSIKGRHLWVKPAENVSSSGTPVFSEDRERLVEVLNGGRYLEIEKDFLN